MSRIVLSVFILILGLSIGQSQSDSYSSLNGATEFAIPVSPAFDMLGINPNQVARPANIRDVKVDWSFRSWRLKPNLALQAQPVWEIMYNRPNLSKYRKANKWMQTLSTLDISAGTIEDDDLTRRLSVAAKLNIYRERDPLLVESAFSDIETQYEKDREAIQEKIDEIKRFKRSNRTHESRDSLSDVIDGLKNEIDALDRNQKQQIQDVAKHRVQKYWNTSYVDVAFGKIYSYKNDSLSNLKLRGEGYAFWVNGCMGIGRKVLLSGVVKYTALNADIEESQTMQGIFSMGVAFRYGSPRFNFFAETFYSSSNSDIVFDKASSALSQITNFSASYGGDWRISRNVLLSYGVRTNYDDSLTFRNLIPVASVSCLMR
ncbi:MAG: hypothetical protein K9I85_08990 [Saprospiraceae bacterium]|nr:hypothetical protein [Saprospiraceae bacterium]